MTTVLSASLTVLRAMALALSSGAACACAAAPDAGASLILTEQSSRAITFVRIGEPVEIRLRSQPGTGFSWVPKAFAANLTAEQPIRGPSIPGGWQTQRYRFLAKHVGTFRLIFSYDQPWSGGTKGARTATFMVTVR